MNYDLIIIGGGPGGYSCALRAVQYGLRTALIEKDLLGGTCLNRGCIPTKTLLFAAGLLTNMKQGAKFGVAADNVRPDYGALRARCADVTGQLRTGLTKLLKQRKIDIYAGTGRVTAAGEVTVAGAEGDTVLTAADIVLATGSVPAVPPIPGADLPGVMTSDDILADLPELSRLVIIGGGVIGTEFAEVYRALGTEVTIVEAMPRILPPMSADLARHLAADFRKKGVKVITKASVTEIAQTAGGLAVRYALGDKAEEIEADGVLIATGRRASVAGLTPFTFEEDRRRVVVDEHCQTSVPHVYAIGDITAGFPQLAHTAEAQGKIAAAAIAGRSCGIRLDLIPSVVYTRPEIASVGVSEDDAKASGRPYRVGRAMMGANAKSLIAGEAGYMKLIADGEGRLIGAEFQCEEASNLVSEATLAIAAGMGAEQFASIVRPHPSVEEAMGETAEGLLTFDK